MNRMRAVNISTACGRIRHVSLETFVAAVKTHFWHDDHLIVDVRDGHLGVYPFPKWLRKHFVFDKKPILEQIVPQLEKSQLIYKGLETVHEAACLSAIEMGNPEMMVRIGPRRWMIACPDDFRVFDRGGIPIIVCMHPKRNLLIELSRS